MQNEYDKHQVAWVPVTTRKCNQTALGNSNITSNFTIKQSYKGQPTINFTNFI